MPSWLETRIFEAERRMWALERRYSRVERRASRLSQLWNFWGGAVGPPAPTQPSPQCCNPDPNPGDPIITIPRTLQTNIGSITEVDPIQVHYDDELSATYGFGVWHGTQAITTGFWSLPSAPCTVLPGTTTIYREYEFACRYDNDGGEAPTAWYWMGRYRQKLCGGTSLPWIQNSPGDYNMWQEWSYYYLDDEAGDYFECAPYFKIVRGGVPVIWDPDMPLP